MPVLEKHDDSSQRVAVLAIHGVGEHKPGAISADVKNLLLNACGDEYVDDRSATFTLRTTTDGLYPHDVSPETSPPTVFARLRRGLGSGFLHRRDTIKTASSETSSVDQRFTQALLVDGHTYTSDYTTVRHSLRRKAENSNLDVDIFELHWSDLSHGGISGALKIADEFLQLLLHVASLGRTTLASVVDDLDLNGTANGTWRRLYRISALTYWLLAMPITLGNLVFLLMAGLLAPALLPISTLNVALAVLMGGTAAVVIGWGYFKYLDTGMAAKARNSVPLSVVPLSFIAGVGIGLLVWIYIDANGRALVVRFLAAGFAAILLGVLGTYLVRIYDGIRPGALLLWVLMLLSVIALSCYVVFDASVIASPGIEDNEHRLLVWLGHISEGAYVALTAVWTVLFAANVALLVGAFLAGFRPWREEETSRALGTALIAAALPAPLLLSVILAVWTAFYKVLEPELPLVAYDPWFGGSLFQGVHTIRDYLHALITTSASYVFIPYLILMAGAGLLIAWGVLPSIKAELFRPSFQPNSHSAASSRMLGRWLDGGFMSMKWGMIVAGIAFFFLFPYEILAPVIGSRSAPEQYEWIASIGAGIGAGAAGFLAATRLFAKWFSDVFKRFRVVVDAALDVDNWLRERPRGNTPRLRIFARFSTLLRHIQSGNYSRIVVVAHSQGTVVAADFFRYLRIQLTKERFETLPPIRLLTMGCPLRQLYALRFPVLYRWVRRPPGASIVGPDSQNCGFSQWINAYGSGDYVGRYLWASDSAGERWDVGTMSRGTGRNTAEFCLGPQAHTHYLDRDSVQVAAQLDMLIAEDRP